MEYIDKLQKAQRIVIKQYAYGTVRIDDGISLTKKFNDKNAVSIGGGGGGYSGGSGFAGSDSRVNVVFGINTNHIVDGEIKPTIYLPPADALVINGENIQVQPPNGAQVQGQSHYLVLPGSDLWCAVVKNSQEKRLEAGIFSKNDIPKNAVFKFHVAKVPRNLDVNNVIQYTLGTVFVNTDDAPFKIVAVKATDSDDSEPDDEQGNTDGGDSYDVETAWDAYDEADYDIDHHRFDNCYYSLGEQLCKVTIPENKNRVEDFAGKFVCLQVPVTLGNTDPATIVGFDSLNDLQQAQKDVDYVTKPLYKLDEAGSVEVDFRKGIHIQVMEEV